MCLTWGSKPSEMVYDKGRRVQGHQVQLPPQCALPSSPLRLLPGVSRVLLASCLCAFVYAVLLPVRHAHLCSNSCHFMVPFRSQPILCVGLPFSAQPSRPLLCRCSVVFCPPARFRDSLRVPPPCPALLGRTWVPDKHLQNHPLRST